MNLRYSTSWRLTMRRGLLSLVFLNRSFRSVHYPIDFVVKHPLRHWLGAHPGVVLNIALRPVQRSTSVKGRSALNSSSLVSPRITSWVILGRPYSPGFHPGLFWVVPTGLKRAEVAVENLVELTGIEPVTPCLQSRCSPS
jgi:hypothetical protein